jgi:hypothetical protein
MTFNTDVAEISFSGRDMSCGEVGLQFFTEFVVLKMGYETEKPAFRTVRSAVSVILVM